MLRLVTVCRPAKAFIFYSGHPDVCTAIIMIISIIIIIIIIIIMIIILKKGSGKFITGISGSIIL